ncbi:MAG TPA: Hsp20/alpha crystallin family protein [Candidatus Obscuribacterales bacterium]
MATGLMQTKEHADIQTNGNRAADTQRTYTPATDIYESADHLLLLTDMPGVKPEGVDITVEQNMLTIHGHVSMPKLDGYSLMHAEYGMADYRRVFALSNEIDREGIQASVKNGVLKLVLPKSKKAAPRKITVKG